MKCSILNRVSEYSSYHIPIESELAQVIPEYKDFLKPRSRIRGREFSEATEISAHLLSNEPRFYTTLPYTAEASGAAAGLGLDQMLDVAATHDNLSEVFAIDGTQKVSTTTRALLEIGSNASAVLGRYVTPQEYVRLFSRENRDLALSLAAPALSKNELSVFRHAHDERLSKAFSLRGGPYSLEHYLNYKANQTNQPSWLSSSDNLAKVLEMYGNGSLHIVQGDITSPNTLPAIGRYLEHRGVLVEYFYVSNALYYLDPTVSHSYGTYNNFLANLNMIPMSSNARIVKTDNIRERGVHTMPRQEAVESDPYLDHEMVDWTYVVQSIADFDTHPSDDDFPQGIDIRLRHGGHITEPRTGLYIVG